MRILRGLSSRVLPCGCLAGVYETYDGKVVAILDAKGPSCADAAHQLGRRTSLDEGQGQSASSIAGAQTNRPA